MTPQEELSLRSLPSVWPQGGSLNGWPIRKSEITHLLCREFAGFSPDFIIKNETVAISCNKNGYGGKATITKLDIRFRSAFAFASFPCTLAVPNKGEEPYPVFVALSFTPDIADGLGEEIIDSGFAIANIYYQAIAPDKNDNFENGLGRFSTRNPYDSWGKLAMWAFGISRAADFLFTLPQLDAKRFAVIGHSRLGKAALWCGAMDERFSLVASVQSGGGGAALFRGKTGENIKNLSGNGSKEWFCQNFFKYTDSEATLPYDQHFLLSLIAPRHLYIASASEDLWSDPRSEFLAAMAASPVYENMFAQGLSTNGQWPICNTPYHDGDIGYHMRLGTHYFSREDWKMIIDYRYLHSC